MRSVGLISALLCRLFIESTDHRDKEETHNNIIAIEDLHEAKEHVPLDGSRKRIQMLKMIEIRISGSTCAVY